MAEEAPDSPHLDLDLSDVLPQVWQIGPTKDGKVYQLSSDLSLTTLYEVGACAQAVAKEVARKAIEPDTDLTAVETRTYTLIANLLNATVDEARALGWQAAQRIIAFLAQPWIDQQRAMNSLSPPSPSPQSSTEESEPKP